MKLTDLSKINNLIYFSINDLLVLNQNESKKSLEVSISRWLKTGDLISLKKGLYITKLIFEKYKSDSSFIEFLASRLKIPSYISGTYVLRKYDILTDATFGVTSMTLKRERKYNNKFGSFIYKNINAELFIGYETKYFLDNEYLIAKRSKALFDYLYLNSSIISINSEINIAEELRLKIDGLTKDEFGELIEFGEISGSPKMKKIIKNIISHASNY